MERVHFIAPVYSNDLRNVLASHTAPEHDVFAVAYRTAYGEVRVINWLTFSEAHKRRDALANRGYKAIVGPMDVQ